MSPNIQPWCTSPRCLQTEINKDKPCRNHAKKSLFVFLSRMKCSHVLSFLCHGTWFYWAGLILSSSCRYCDLELTSDGFFPPSPDHHADLRAPDLLLFYFRYTLIALILWTPVVKGSHFTHLPESPAVITRRPGHTDEVTSGPARAVQIRGSTPEVTGLILMSSHKNKILTLPLICDTLVLWSPLKSIRKTKTPRNCKE